MYHIATVEDFPILRNTYDFASEWRNTAEGFPLPTLSDGELLGYIENGKIIISDLCEDNYAAHICFDVTDRIQIVWSIPDNRHQGMIDAMNAYLIMTHKRPFRFWVVGGSQTEKETLAKSAAENATLIQSEVNEYGKTMNLYEFTAPELAYFKESEEV